MNPEDMTQEQAEDMEAEYIATGIEALEKESGLELGEEAIDDVVERARANRGENQEPLVADAFGSVLGEIEAEGAIDYGPEEEALEDFEQPTGPTAEQLAGMLRGDHGPELQAQALQAVGLDTEEAAGEEWGNDWAMEFLAQQEQLEKKLGRELTGPEAKALEDDAAGTDKPLDLLGRYDDVVGRDVRRNSDDRHDVMVEAFEDSQNQDNGDGSYTDDWEPEEEPKAPDLTNDEDRQAAMVAEMKEAEAA